MIFVWRLKTYYKNFQLKIVLLAWVVVRAKDMAMIAVNMI